MVTAEFTRKPPRPRNPAPVLVRRLAERRVRKPDPLREDLFHLIRKLQLTMAVVMAAVKALQAQAAEQDEDIALVLQRYVCDALGIEVDKWDALLRVQGYAGKPTRH